MDVNKSTALRIMRKREELGISQKDLAIAIDMSKSTYCDKENGKTDITINELERIAKGLHVSLAFLLGIDEKSVQNNSNSIVLNHNNSGTIYFQPSPETIEKIKKE